MKMKWDNGEAYEGCFVKHTRGQECNGTFHQTFSRNLARTMITKKTEIGHPKQHEQKLMGEKAIVHDLTSNTSTKVRVELLVPIIRHKCEAATLEGCIRGQGKELL